MIWAMLSSLLVGAINSGTSLLYATLGEVVEERAGIINLGLEGVMLMGAVCGFAVTVKTGNPAFGLLGAAFAGASFNLFFGFLVINRRANQLACGLAMMFFGVGLSALMGVPFIGSKIKGLDEIELPLLAQIPFLGPVFFRHDLLTYAVIPIAIFIWWLLFHTRFGLSLRSVGENPAAAFAAGKNPYFCQYQALFLAGILGGLAGAHLSIALAKTWQEWMTGGRGFIAVALVIFSKWHPLWAIAGALIFGGAIALQIQLQAIGIPISSFLLDMLPYLLSLGILAIWGGRRRSAAPGSLGRVFQGTE